MKEYKAELFLVIIPFVLLVLFFGGSMVYVLITEEPSSSVNQSVHEVDIEQVDAVITKINKTTTFSVNHKKTIKMQIQDTKYGLTKNYNSFASGVLDNPLYWEKEKGDVIPVVITTVTNKDTGEIINQTIDFI